MLSTTTAAAQKSLSLVQHDFPPCFTLNDRFGFIKATHCALLCGDWHEVSARMHSKPAAVYLRNNRRISSYLVHDILPLRILMIPLISWKIICPMCWFLPGHPTSAQDRDGRLMQAAFWKSIIVPLNGVSSVVFWYGILKQILTLRGSWSCVKDNHQNLCIQP